MTATLLVEPDRDYQIRAVRDITNGLAAGGRGQLHAACGTGKTKMGLWVAERLVGDDGVVVIAVPTVGLVAQTLREWAEVHPDHIALAVCGDGTITVSASGPPTNGGDDDDAEAERVALDSILEPVTTDPDVVTAWLMRQVSTTLRLIVVTHRSAHVVGEGLQKAGREAGLLLVDEAHRTAGSADKRTALIHDDDVLPARRRLYMTATPRVFGAASVKAVVSMDDTAVYGPVLFNYPFSQAISDGYLDDYRLLVVGITRAEVLAVLRAASERVSPGAALPSEHSAMVQAAIARAARRYDLRRVLAFCPRVSDAKEFADTFADTMDCLPSGNRPPLPVHATHVSGHMKQDKRQEALDTLAAPPNGGWTVVSNARCLSEGIDVPAVDAVAFTAPKESPVDIVQAIGRALRPVPGKGAGIATILVPVLLDSDGDDGADVGLDSVDAGSFALLLQVAAALRSHDDAFAASLRPARVSRNARSSALQKTEVLVPQEVDSSEFLQHLTVHVVRSTHGTWWEGYDELVTVARLTGDANIKTDLISPSGYPVGQWLATACADARANRLLSDRVDALVALGVRLGSRHQAAWERWYELASAFYAGNGHLRPPSRETKGQKGPNLYDWVHRQRKRRDDGTLTPEQVARLDAIGMEWENPRDRDRQDPKVQYEKRQKLVERLAAYVAEHGELPQGRSAPRTPSKDLRRLRAAYREKSLEPEFVDRLTAWGMDWETDRTTTPPPGTSTPGTSTPPPAAADPAWLREGVVHMLRYHEREGKALVSHTFVTPEGFPLGKWANDILIAYRHGQLDSASIDALTRIGFTLPFYRGRWERMYRLASEYAEANGNLAMTKRTKLNGIGVGEWLVRQRRAAQEGSLAEEKRARLAALDPRWDRPRKTSSRGGRPKVPWHQWLRSFQDFHAEHGRLPLVTEGKLGVKLSALRRQYRTGDLHPEVIADMEALGIEWAPYRTAWDRAIAAATRFSHHHGHLDTRHRLPDYTDTVDPQFDLDKWVRNLRTYVHRGKLTEDQITQVEALGMVWVTTWRRSRR